MNDLDILVTNDDGVDATGLEALCDALSSVGSVTAVAPADDQSAVGRALTHSTTVTEFEHGYVLDGTPSDCVIAGLSTLATDADIVVAGCNEGANLGSAVLGRSGTVSAAVEATFFGVPAIAVSMYVPPEHFEDDTVTLPPEQYHAAVDSAAYLTEHAFEADIFDHVDYLNLNAPIAQRSTGEMEITRPSHIYQMGSRRDGETITLENHIWEQMAAGDIPDPEGTDRRAVVENRISVSPLSAPHTCRNSDELVTIADQYAN